CAVQRRVFHSFPTRRSSDLGSKTLLFETAEQLEWRLPDAVVIPVASGALFVNTAKAARELVDAELVRPLRARLFGAQPEGCAPRSEEHTSELQSRENLVCRP